MTIISSPDFLEYIIITNEGWELQENAPPEVKRKFKEFMEQIDPQGEN